MSRWKNFFFHFVGSSSNNNTRSLRRIAIFMLLTEQLWCSDGEQLGASICLLTLCGYRAGVRFHLSVPARLKCQPDNYVMDTACVLKHVPPCQLCQCNRFCLHSRLEAIRTKWGERSSNFQESLIHGQLQLGSLASLSVPISLSSRCKWRRVLLLTFESLRSAFGGRVSQLNVLEVELSLLVNAVRASSATRQVRNRFSVSRPQQVSEIGPETFLHGNEVEFEFIYGFSFH